MPQFPTKCRFSMTAPKIWSNHIDGLNLGRIPVIACNNHSFFAEKNVSSPYKGSVWSFENIAPYHDKNH